MLSRTFVIFSLLLTAAACSPSRKTEKPQQEKTPDYAALNYEKGTVKYWELDGCRYMIETENGKKLNPGSLDSAYAKDGLKVWVRYKQVNRMNICMSGITVDISDIQKRQE